MYAYRVYGHGCGLRPCKASILHNSSLADVWHRSQEVPIAKTVLPEVIGTAAQVAMKCGRGQRRGNCAKGRRRPTKQRVYGVRGGGGGMGQTQPQEGGDWTEAQGTTKVFYQGSSNAPPT